MKKEENYYELLKVDRKATVSEIVTAYHSARNAFSKDSMAIYSLFSPQETEEVLKKLEEAYLTLSNLDRKRDYDKKFGSDPTPSPAPSSAPRASEPSARPAFVTVTVPTAKAAPAPSTAAPAATAAATTTTEVAAAAPATVIVNGDWLRQAREQHGMTIEDVSRLTKIPLSTMKAIETDNLKKLPARVYLQGFVSNLLKVYRIDTKTTKLYLETIDALLRPPSVS